MLENMDDAIKDFERYVHPFAKYAETHGYDDIIVVTNDYGLQRYGCVCLICSE